MSNNNCDNRRKKKWKMKVKFDRYDVTLKGHQYCVLVPHNVDQLWITGYEDRIWGINWEGNRKGLKALLYASVILGFNPTDKIIYFPIRKNCKAEFFRVPETAFEIGQTYVDDCDLIWTTHQVQLRRSRWKDIKNAMRFCKKKTYTLDYDKIRTEQYFSETFEKWENGTACRHKEYLIEIIDDNVLFQVFSKMQFRQIYLQLNEFLHSNLELRFEENFPSSTPVDGVWLEYTRPIKEKEKQITDFPWAVFYDLRFERLVKEKRKSGD